MKRSTCVWLVVAPPMLLCGCIGRDRVGAFTTDNFGIAVQSTPTPQVAFDFSRQEGALEPVFEDGSTPSIAASVQHTSSAGITKLSDSTKAIFAGGNAAVLAAGDTPGALSAVACLATPLKSFDSQIINAPGSSTPLLFGTDTVIGFKVAFAVGATPGLVSGNLGYKRDEMAISPVFGLEHGCSHEDLLAAAEATQNSAQSVQDADQAKVAADNDALKKLSSGADPAQLQKALKADQAKLQDDTIQLGVAKSRFHKIDGDPKYDKYAVYVPSTLAVASDDVGATPSSSGGSGTFDVAQVFATGKAAEVIAKQDAFGAIGNVAAAVTKQTPSNVATSGKTFTISHDGELKAGMKAVLAPAISVNQSDLKTVSFTYQLTSKDATDADVAKGLVEKINSYPADQGLGITAKPSDNQLSLVLPTNLGAISNNIKWVTTGTDKAIHITPQGTNTISN